MISDGELFINEFITKINGLVESNQLSEIKQLLSLQIMNYQVSRKSTEVSTYIDRVPSFYKDYIVARKIEGVKDSSLKLYNMYLQHFFSNMDKPIEQITTNDIRSYLYITQKNRGISNRTLDTRRTVINTFLEWSTNEGYLTKNVCRNISPIKYNSKPRQPLSDIELEMVRNACNSLRDKAIIEFLYSTGCRVSELVHTDVNDINFECGEVLLFGKGEKYRTSYLSAKASLCLKNYLNDRTDNNMALFISKRKPYKRLSKSAIELIVDEIGVRSGLNRKLFPHLIRGTFASSAVRKNMSIQEVQKILGHVSIVTTTHYAQLVDEDVKHDHKKYIV